MLDPGPVCDGDIIYEFDIIIICVLWRAFVMRDILCCVCTTIIQTTQKADPCNLAIELLHHHHT